jgi:hypothetical protein
VAPQPIAVHQGSTSSSVTSDTDGYGSGSSDKAFEKRAGDQREELSFVSATADEFEGGAGYCY